MRITTILTAMAGLVTASVTLAQSQDKPVLEEVVVSGYRQQTAREAELSLSLLSADDMEQASIAQFEELIPLVPNMNWSGEGSRARYLQLRGIGEREQYEGAPNPSVGFFIDDIDLSGIGGIASTFDLQRAEVLRGPQSARFGSSALAGLVYLRSTEPADEFSARVELSAGDDGLLAGGVALGGAISDHARGRLSLFRHGSDGFRRNAWLGGATNERDELTARGKLGWEFGSGWEGMVTILYADYDNGYDAWTVRNDNITHADRPGHDTQRTVAGSLRLEGPVAEGLELASITSLADTDVLFSFDGDWGNPGFWQSYGDYVYDYEYLNPRQRDAFSQELRLVSGPGRRLLGATTDWVIGAAWSALDENNRIDSTGVYDDSGEEAFCLPCVTDRQITSRFESRTLALFAATETALADRWSLSLGLRFERWEAAYGDRWEDVNYPGPPGGSSCARFVCEPDDDLWGGHVALSFDASDSVRLYARIARGFKAGGFNPSLAALQGVAMLGPDFVPYRAETLTNYELGLKGSWRDGTVSAELAGFYMDREDAQLSQSSQQVAFDPNSFVFVTYNGAARVQGLDASAEWRVNDTWRLHGALGLLDSEIEDTQTTREVSPDAVGRALAHAPDYTLSLGASFATAAGWFGRIDINAMDDFYFDISHNQSSGSHATANLRLGRAVGDWTVSAWMRNLTDEKYFTRGFYFGNEPPGFAPTLYTRFGDPRSFGLTVAWRAGGG